MLEQGRIELAGFGQHLGSTLEINGIPERYRGHNQVQPTGPVSLVLKRTITNFPEPVKEDGSGQCIASFSFIKTGSPKKPTGGSSHPMPT